MKEISSSSKVLKLQSSKPGPDTFGFEDFEFGADGKSNFDKGSGGIPGRVREEIERRLKEIEQKEAIAEKKGYEQGFTQGEKDGREIGRQSMEVIATQLSGLIEKVNGIPGEIASKYSDLIRDIIVDVSSRVVQVEIENNNEIIRKSLEMAFSALDEAHRVTVRLNPRDLTLLKENVIDSFGDKLPEETKIVWKPDPDIHQGGCVLETDTQLIDATIESRLKQVRDLLGKA